MATHPRAPDPFRTKAKVVCEGCGLTKTLAIGQTVCDVCELGDQDYGIDTQDSVASGEYNHD